MPKSSAGLLAVLLLFTSTCLHAQNGGRVGLGVGLELDGSTPTLDIRVPILIGSHLRLEPAIGFLDEHNSIRTFTESGQTDSAETGARAFHLSLALSRIFRVDDRISLFVGPEVGALHVKTTDKLPALLPAGTELTASRTDPHIGIQAGADAHVASHLTVGAEVELRYSFIGETSFNPDPVPFPIQWTFQDSGHALATRGAFVARWYF